MGVYMSPLEKQKAVKIVSIFSVVWVIVCALFSLCGEEYYIPCLACAAAVVGFAWLCIPLWEHDYKQYLKEVEEKRKREEKVKHEVIVVRPPIWPIIRRVIGVIVCVIIIASIIGCIMSGIGAFVDSYGMVAFLLLLLLAVMAFRK